MDILKTPLEILFKDRNPYSLLSNYFDKTSFDEGSHLNLKKDLFIKLFQEKEKQLSKDEIKNLYEIVCENMKKSIQGCELEKSVFTLLINYTEKILDDCGDTVRCKYKDLLKWRMITLKLDPDMFICAFLAYKDLMIGIDRHSYDWNTIIKSNNIRLHNMLSKGMAENHFHLNGSAPTFKLSWISLMNDIHCKDLSRIKLEKNRLNIDLDGNVNTDDLILLATILRVILFSQINSDNTECEFLEILKNILEKDSSGNVSLNTKLLSVFISKIQCEINSLKFIYGSRLKYKENYVCADYALTSKINKNSRGIRLFLGERALLYQCFKKIYSNDERFKKNIDLFYIYLIIKNRVRAELIQENDKVGFANFKDYQDRKTKYIKKNTILKEAIEPSAILTSIKTQNIKVLETRVIPSNNANKNVKYIENKDMIICNNIINDNDNFWNNKEIQKYKKRISSLDIEHGLSLSEMSLLYGKNNIDNINKSILEKYFYVYHFPKQKDELEGVEKENLLFCTRCRHDKYRKKLKENVIAIYNMRENNQKQACRIVGIDACSSELDARPEVYGQAFRFLKKHLPSNDYLGEFYGEKGLSKLRSTYHVGEDFLDIVDGLRAIDEAIIFLDLTHGDRLGHAIALGINAEEWYTKKLNRVYLSKQDILDNVAWLINKIKQYDISAGPDTIDKLLKIYNKYYREIYTVKFDNYFLKSKEIYKNEETVLDSTKSDISIDAYIAAWNLRGDNPEAYIDGNYINKGISYWDRCAVRNKEHNGLVCELYYRYHYDPEVKYEGDKKEVFKIEKYMVDAIKEVQKSMQVSIRKMGIGIETNPSSNVKISTFGRYDKHPILNMNNRGLENDYRIENEIPQLFVSINTDDQGVFDTLLENEYALMGIALEKVKDEDGKCVYNQSNIYGWLDKIREMGIEQSFKAPREW